VDSLHSRLAGPVIDKSGRKRKQIRSNGHFGFGATAQKVSGFHRNGVGGVSLGLVIRMRR